jgi:hypothetical protein
MRVSTLKRALALGSLVLAFGLLVPDLADARRGGGGGGRGGGGRGGGRSANVHRGGPASHGSMRSAPKTYNRRPSRPAARPKPASRPKPSTRPTPAKQPAQARPDGASQRARADDRGSNQKDRADNRGDLQDNRQDWKDQDREDRQDYRDDARKEVQQNREDVRKEMKKYNNEYHEYNEWKEHNEWYDDRWKRALGYSMTSAAFHAMTCSMTSVMVQGMTYYGCGSSWYNRSYSGGNVTYVVVNTPPGY